MANVKLKWVFVSDWVGGVGGGRLCTTAGDQLAQGNPPGARPDNNLHHNLHPRHSYRFEEKTFKFWWYTNYYWFLLEDILTYPIMWSEYSRCNSRPVASKGLLAGCPQEAFKSELRWDQCETSSCTECKLLNKLNSKSNDIEEGWYGALGAKPVEVLGHWPIQPGAQGGVVMDGFLNCPFFTLRYVHFQVARRPWVSDAQQWQQQGLTVRGAKRGHNMQVHNNGGTNLRLS